MRISKSTQSIEFLSTQFPSAELSLYKSEPEDYISCFVCKLKNEDELLFLWKKIASVIAYEYQSELENKFDAWNIYLAFVVTSSITKTTKYEIENNKFSMRKLVVSDAEINFDAELYLNNEILGADLKLCHIFSYVPPTDDADLTPLNIKLNQLISDKRSNSTLSSENVLHLAKWISDNEI